MLYFIIGFVLAVINSFAFIIGNQDKDGVDIYRGRELLIALFIIFSIYILIWPLIIIIAIMLFVDDSVNYQKYMNNLIRKD